MADSNTTITDLLKMETGTHDNDWGINLNAQLDALDLMVKGTRTTVTTGGTTVLTKTTAREPVQRVTGVLVANAIIEVPVAATSYWLFRNETTGAFTVTVKVNGQTGIVVTQGSAQFLRQNGTDVVSLGNFAQRDTANTFTAAQTFADVILGGRVFRLEPSLTVAAGSVAWDMAVSGPDVLVAVPASNITFAIPTGIPATISSGTIRISNASGAVRTIAWAANYGVVNGTLPSTIGIGETLILQYRVIGSIIYITNRDDNRNSSGTYTPTSFNGANVAASTTYPAQWMRVGNVVTVSGRADIDAITTGLLTGLGLSLPIASTITQLYNCCGTANAGAGGNISALNVQGDTVNNRAFITGIIGTAANDAVYYTFTYLVQ